MEFVKNILLNQDKRASLTSRIFKGGILIGAGNSVEQGIRFVRNMILTRLLAPEAFGLMAIILAVKMASESLTDIGIKYAVIQHPEGHDRNYINAAWWLALGRGVILYIIAFVSAPFIASFYQNAELVPLMYVAFLGIVFNGAMSTKAYVAIKQMEFKRWVILFNGGGLLGILTTIVLAFIIKNVWALVIGLTIESASRLLLSFIMCPFSPDFNFKKELTHDLFKFTKGILGLGILYFIFLRADIFVVGKLCSTTELGLYSMAVGLAFMPFELLSGLLDKLGMATFSEIQSEKFKVVNSIMIITSSIIFLGFPLLFFITLYGKDILGIVYGAQYAEVAIPFAIIFGSTFIRMSSVPIAQVYFASGHPELHRLFTAIRTILIIALIYPATKWFGLIGAASASLIAMAIGYFFQVIKLKQLYPVNLIEYGRIFVKGFLISIPVLIIWYLTYIILSFHAFQNIIMGVIGCIISYIAVYFVFIRPKKRLTELIPVLMGKFQST